MRARHCRPAGELTVALLLQFVVDGVFFAKPNEVLTRMEALSLPINTLTLTNSNAKYICLSATSIYASLFSLQLSSSTITPLTLKSVLRVQAESEDYELKQMRDMVAARKRWDALII
ncbi:hypothetical protein SESBI_03704 [Sesbania bispinosa]|nr:hypothetical protein SESBI_03704 [Sesbania bispinosa]